MKALLVLITINLIIPVSWAQDRRTPIDLDYLSIQPIVGFERVQKLEPTPYSTSRFIYGARINYGPPIISAELEVTRGQDSKTFPEQNLRVEEEVTNIMGGARSSHNFGGLLDVYLRAGGHTRKSKLTQTRDSATVTRRPASYVSPYVGTGASVNVLNIFTLNAGLTVLFTDRPESGDREYQTTLGFGLRI